MIPQYAAYFHSYLKSRTSRPNSKEMASTIHVQISDTEKNVEDCVICLEPMTAKEAVAAAYKCRHIFHEDCISSWGTYSFLCPCCRARKTVIPHHRLSPDDSRLEAVRLEWMYAATFQENGSLDPAAFCARSVGSSLARSLWVRNLLLTRFCNNRLEEGRNNFIAKWGGAMGRR